MGNTGDMNVGQMVRISCCLPIGNWKHSRRDPILSVSVKFYLQIV